MPQYFSDFSDFLKKEREKRSMTMEKFSELISSDITSLYRWEKGYTPRNNTRSKIISSLGFHKDDIIFTNRPNPKTIYETINYTLNGIKTNILLRCYPLMNIDNYSLWDLSLLDDEKLNPILYQLQDFEQGIRPHPVDIDMLKSWIFEGKGVFISVNHFGSLTGHLICLDLGIEIFNQLISLEIKESELYKEKVTCLHDIRCLYIYSISANNNTILLMMLNQLLIYTAYRIKKIKKVGCLCSLEEGIHLAEAFGLRPVVEDNSYGRFRHHGKLIDCVTYSNSIEELHVYNEVIRKSKSL